jgi:hypothetical protein
VLTLEFRAQLLILLLVLRWGALKLGLELGDVVLGCTLLCVLGPGLPLLISHLVLVLLLHKRKRKKKRRAVQTCSCLLICLRVWVVLLLVLRLDPLVGKGTSLLVCLQRTEWNQSGAGAQDCYSHKLVVLHHAIWIRLAIS